MDGHDTHETPALKCVVYKHLNDEDLEIIIFCFPSKTTHKCQLLDVILFAHVERKWQDVCNKCIKDRVTINRYNVIPLYVCSTQAAMTKDLIRAAFRETGIYPLDCSVFKPEDFAPSKASSSITHVPDTFPDDVPSSDPVEPENEDYKPVDIEMITSSDSDLDSDSDSTGSENSTIKLTDSEPEDDAVVDLDRSDGNIDLAATEDGDLRPRADEAVTCSGLMELIAKIENDIIHTSGKIP